MHDTWVDAVEFLGFFAFLAFVLWIMNRD